VKLYREVRTFKQSQLHLGFNKIFLCSANGFSGDKGAVLGALSSGSGFLGDKQVLSGNRRLFVRKE